MFRLDGKSVIVTGAGSGIGASIAELFAKQGARVMALDVSLEAAERTAEALRASDCEVDALHCDVGDADSVTLAFEIARARMGGIDILVNNAGIAHVGMLESTSEADFDRLYRVNAKGVFLCAQAVLPALQARGGGVILNMCSIAALIGIEARFAYSMTKGAVLAMTRSIAVDYVAQKIRCNCICPARIHTPFVDGFLAKNYPGKEREMFEKLSAYQPIGRMGTPEEVAQLALYLCSDAASFVTGQAFPIDGGVLMK
ncbi:MAG TPA: SDR family oxidoreductase [Planctomycetota bacterium]|nr:SDR family oxidoreductase [Planctomycetota bacterium]